MKIGERLRWLDSCEYDYIFSGTGDTELTNPKGTVVSNDYAIAK